MAYAFVQDIAASWQQYELTTAATMEPVPRGLILHVAGPTAEGFRIIDVWETEDAWHRFRAERLAPAIAALGGPARPEPTFRDVQADHVVFGGAITSQARLRKEGSRGDFRRGSTLGHASQRKERQDA